jgi:hypothetical protein
MFHDGGRRVHRVGIAIALIVFSGSVLSNPVTVYTNLLADLKAFSVGGVQQVVVAGGNGVMKGNAVAGAASAPFEYTLTKNANATFDATAVTALPGFPGANGIPALILHPAPAVGHAASAAASASYALATVKIMRNNQEVNALRATLGAAAEATVDKDVLNHDSAWAKATVGDPLYLDTGGGSLGVMFSLLAGSTLGADPGARGNVYVANGSSAIDSLLDIAFEVAVGSTGPDLLVTAMVDGILDASLGEFIDSAFAYNAAAYAFVLGNDVLVLDKVLAPTAGLASLNFSLTAETPIPEPGTASLALVALGAVLVLSMRMRPRRRADGAA